MKDELLLDEALKKPDFLCESGSHLYGMATSASDYDLRGFLFAPTLSYMMGIKKFQSKEMENDKKIY